MTTGTDSVWMVVPSLADRLMLNEELAGRPEGTATST